MEIQGNWCEEPKFIKDVVKECYEKSLSVTLTLTLISVIASFHL